MIYNQTFFSCPEISEADFKLMNDMAYWLEGVIQTGKQNWK